MNREKFKRTPIEKFLFALAFILGLNAIVVGIVSGCFGYLSDCAENCERCIPIISVVFVLVVMSIIYYTNEPGKTWHRCCSRLQERCGDNNAMIIATCLVSIMVFSQCLYLCLCQVLYIN